MDFDVKPPEMSFYTGPKYLNGMRRLNRRQRGETLTPDLVATVRATVKALGLPHLVYRAGSRPAEYLLLVDTASSKDHQAALFERLIHAMRGQGLYCEVYEFEQDPRICVKPESGQEVYLEDIGSRFSGHRLVLLTDGECLMDGFEGGLAAWSTFFERWEQRAILTPADIADWGMTERVLTRKFVVAPATEQGLETISACFEFGTRGANVPDQEKPLGAKLPESGADVAALKAWLGPLFPWLCGCAVYPELEWDLTLRLGLIKELGIGLLQEANVMLLARLPWFRSGWIPDELRLRLIDCLKPEQEAAVCADIALHMRLRSQSEAGGRHSRAMVVRFNELLAKCFDRRQGLAGEFRSMTKLDRPGAFVLLRQLERLVAPRLAFVMPDRVRRLMFEQGVIELGARRWVQLALVGLLLVGLLGGLMGADAKSQSYQETFTNLGVQFRDGDGVPQDYSKARALFRAAAVSGGSKALTYLGTLYERGLGVRQDYTKAREMYLKAAADGQIYAMTYLGSLYERGLGVPKDDSAALQWYQRLPPAEILKP